MRVFSFIAFVIFVIDALLVLYLEDDLHEFVAWVMASIWAVNCYGVSCERDELKEKLK